MHEYSIIRALLGRIEEEARARRATAVRRLRVRIGELSGVEPDLLGAAYEIFREGTICAGADLDIERVPARWSCPACDRPIARNAVLSCPACSTPARLAAGGEIFLDRIEMEVP